MSDDSRRPIMKPRIYRARDVYKVYAKKVLERNPDYWGIYGRKMHNFYIYRRAGTKVVEVINYDRFYDIMFAYITEARKHLVKGEMLMLGHNLGNIMARCVERTHSNKQVNWLKSMALPKVMNAEGEMVHQLVYFNDDEYIRMGWKKLGKITNETVYAFQPTRGKRGFIRQFSTANMENPTLKRSYEYFPYLIDKQPKDEAT